MRCKIGDLAYITGSDFPENIGAVVKVVRTHGYSDWGYEWVFEATRPLLGHNPSGNGSGYAMGGIIPDADLRPISGVPVDDQTLIETNVPEAVKLAWGIDAPVLS